LREGGGRGTGGLDEISQNWICYENDNRQSIMSIAHIGFGT